MCNRRPDDPPIKSSGDGRIRSCTEVEGRKSNLGRSRSAQSLSQVEGQGSEDKLTLVSQMLWMTVSLLESDYEYEYSLAVRYSLHSFNDFLTLTHFAVALPLSSELY